jgi:hypothetical protein
MHILYGNGKRLFRCAGLFRTLDWLGFRSFGEMAAEQPVRSAACDLPETFRRTGIRSSPSPATAFGSVFAEPGICKYFDEKSGCIP